MDFIPRMMTFEAPPTPADEALMFTPATLPLSELMKLTSLLAMTASASTCCTLYDSAFSARLMPRAVTTTCSTSMDELDSVMSKVVREPMGTTRVS